MNAEALRRPETPQVRLQPLTLDRLDALLAVERQAYEFPWTHGNFTDSLASGYPVQLLCSAEHLVGYYVAMRGVDEVHLLNLTVAPAFQHQGWARVLLEGLRLWARGEGAEWLWLEVRASNARAQAVYQRFGFRPVGTRPRYYPSTGPEREDAIVMSLPL